jgi:hypothetical protein
MFGGHMAVWMRVRSKMKACPPVGPLVRSRALIFCEVRNASLNGRSALPPVERAVPTRLAHDELWTRAASASLGFWVSNF